MTQTIIDQSLDQLTQEFEAKRASLLALKQQQEAQARQLAQLDANRLAEEQAKAQARAHAQAERTNVIEPAQDDFAAITAKTLAWLEEIATAEARLRALATEQEALLKGYAQAAYDAGERCATHGTTNETAAVLFDSLFGTIAILPVDMPAPIGKHYGLTMSATGIYRFLKNTFWQAIARAKRGNS